MGSHGHLWMTVTQNKITHLNLWTKLGLSVPTTIIRKPIKSPSKTVLLLINLDSFYLYKSSFPTSWHLSLVQIKFSHIKFRKMFLDQEKYFFFLSFGQHFSLTTYSNVTTELRSSDHYTDFKVKMKWRVRPLIKNPIGYIMHSFCSMVV